MVDEATNAPEDVDSLRQQLRDRSAERDLAYEALKFKTLEVEKLKLQVSLLRRQRFGRSSEKLAQAAAQLELAIEEIEASQAALAPVPAEPDEATDAGETNEAAPATKRKPARRPLPAHLPRETVVHAPAAVCPDCGGQARPVGENKSEVLEYVPGHFKVIEHVRPKVSCRACERIRQAPPPSLPIERGLPGPGLLAHVLIGKYCDHRVS